MFGNLNYDQNYKIISYFCPFINIDGTFKEIWFLPVDDVDDSFHHILCIQQAALSSS